MKTEKKQTLISINEAFKQVRIYYRRLRARKVARHYKYKAIIFFMVLLCWRCAPGQFNIISIEQLKNNVDNFYNEKTKAEIEVFKTEVKRTYRDYIPSPSYSPFTGGFAFSLNLQPFIQEKKIRKQEEQKIKSIEQINKLEAKNLKSEIGINYQSIIISIEDYESKKLLYDLKEKTFKIFEKQYTRNDITPTTFLNHQYEFENLKIIRKTEESLIRKEILALYVKSKAAF
jgi:hypothetical protein